MATFCLTTSVKSGEGSIRQPGCEWRAHGPNEDFESCAHDFNQGEIINLMATPSSGWEVFDWESSVPGIFTTSTSGQNSVVMTMPSSDVSVQVIFSHGDVNLILQVGGGNGCIILESPPTVIDCSGTILSLPAGEVRVGAEPDSGWVISRWELDGISYDGTNSYVDFTLYGYTQRSIVVYFESEGDCNKNNLDITIVGKGSVSPPSGKYCDSLTLTLLPVPAAGYFFKKWEYIPQSGISASGISLFVEMNLDRSVTAIFEAIPDYEYQQETLFYCPSNTYRNSVVSFDFTNTSDIDNPSAEESFYFILTFYSDFLKKKVVYSASSLIDNKRWFYKDSYYHPVDADGVPVSLLDTITVVYDPEILSNATYDSQKEFIIGDLDATETPLVCGVKYYVKIEVYNPSNGITTFLENMSIIFDCQDINETRWSFDKDKKNWICSGQGKDDLQVTSTHTDQSIYSCVASNNFGMFQIVWQSRRNNVSSIYGCIWDSGNDLLYSSGQGMYDSLQIENGYNPMVLRDQANNFYISANLKDELLFRNCPFTSFLPSSIDETSTTMFQKFCNPGLSEYLDSSYDQITVRIYEKDVDSSLVINKDKVIPVVNNSSVRLDIDGVSGAYAVRVRHINDEDWSGWINIDSNLYYPEGETQSEDDARYSAYRIDNSRFIVPIYIDKINGIRRICCQVLTLYGITNTYCIEFLANFGIARHVFKFYYKDTYDPGSEFPVYNGRYVLSLKDSDGNIIPNGDVSTVYFEVIFSEDIYKNESAYPPVPYSDGDIKFNVVQQGANDIWDDNGLMTVPGSLRTFRGSFSLYKDDGIFNKDGTAFINLSFPDLYQTSFCLSDTSDKYNVMVKNEDLIRYQNLSPEEIYKKSLSDKAYELDYINRFRQYYSNDDSNFKFGNPLYFYKKGD